MSLMNIIQRYNPINHIRIEKSRRQLQNKRVTILSSNCLGGLLYHELGLQFLSPTINVRFSSKDFVKFVLNIRHYLQLEFEEEKDNELPYPVGRLGDITVYFVHYSSFEDAASKWKERCQRIQWDNVFVLLNDCDGVNEDDMRALDKSEFHSILVFTARKYPNVHCAFPLKNFKNSESVGNTMKKSVLTGAMLAERAFDFVGWFNQEKGNHLEDYRIGWTVRRK